MRRILIMLVCFLPVAAWADYVQVKRSANIYASPDRNTRILESVQPEESGQPVFLLIASNKLQNGYHKVRLLQGSRTGWIYKSRVRLFSGDPPGIERDDFYGGLPDDSQVGDQITRIKNAAYTVGYSETKSNPLWSAYQLGADQGHKCDRLKRFRTDDRTETRVTHDAYNSTGYDRGHMAPSDNIGSRYGCEAQNETYFMSNITPQLPSLNQKSWLGLEMLEASYPEDFGQVWVITGPIFDPVWLNLLCSGVELPVSFYKIIVRDIDEKPSVLAVIFDQNTKPGVELSTLVTTVDEIERRTGIDFLSSLSDDLENSIERTRATDSRWKLNTKLNSSFPGTAREICVEEPVRRN